MSNVVIIANKGYVLPVGECVLIKTEPDAYIVAAAAKVGRGKGVKNVLRQFAIPKAAVAYMYKEKEISAEEAAQYPMSNGVRAGVHAVATPAAAAPAGKVKRHRRTKEEMEAARAAEAAAGGAAPTPARGRKAGGKKVVKAAKAAGKVKRHRRTKEEMEAARAAEAAAGGGKAPKAEKTKRHRRTKEEIEAAKAAGGGKPEKTKRHRRTKAQIEADKAAEATGKAPKAEAAPPADKPTETPAKAKGMSLFGDF